MRPPKVNDTIKVKRSHKHRVPHKPTKVHKSKKKYTRKGKAKDQLRKEYLTDIAK